MDVTGVFERQTPDGGWIPVRNEPVRAFVGDTQVGLALTAAGSSTYLALTGSGDYVDVR